MVTVARYMNVTLIVPELDKTSFWNDPRYVSHQSHLKLLCELCFFNRFVNLLICFLLGGSEFKDIFDLDHFISSLRDEVRILKELPPRLKKRVELGMYHEMPPISWSNMSYYQNQVNFPSFVFSFEFSPHFASYT